MTLQLRPYQSEALLRIREAYKAGKRRVLVSLPTGTGKTVVFAHLPSVLKMRKRLLVLAHREELLVQAQDKFRAVDPQLKVAIEQAGTHASDDASVVFPKAAEAHDPVVHDPLEPRPPDPVRAPIEPSSD